MNGTEKDAEGDGAERPTTKQNNRQAENIRERVPQGGRHKKVAKGDKAIDLCPNVGLREKCRLFLVHNPEFRNTFTPPEDVAELFMKIKTSIVYKHHGIEAIAKVFTELRGEV